VSISGGKLTKAVSIKSDPFGYDPFGSENSLTPPIIVPKLNAISKKTAAGLVTVEKTNEIGWVFLAQSGFQTKRQTSGGMRQLYITGVITGVT
jgi:hypothetical protein